MIRLLVLLFIAALPQTLLAQAAPKPAAPIEAPPVDPADVEAARELAKQLQDKRKLEVAAARFYARSDERRKKLLKDAKADLANETAKLRLIERRPVVAGAKPGDDRSFDTAEAKLRAIQDAKKLADKAEKLVIRIESMPEDYPHLLTPPLKLDDIGELPFRRGKQLGGTEEGETLVELSFPQEGMPDPKRPGVIPRPVNVQQSVLVKKDEAWNSGVYLGGIYRVAGIERRKVNGVQVSVPLLLSVNGVVNLRAEYQRIGVLPRNNAVQDAGPAGAHNAIGGQQVDDGHYTALNRTERLRLFAARSEAQRNEFVARTLTAIAEIKRKRDIAQKTPVDAKFRGQHPHGFRSEASKIEYLARLPKELELQEAILGVLERNDPPHVYVFFSAPKPGEIGRFAPGLVEEKRVTDKEMLLSVLHPDAASVRDELRLDRQNAVAAYVTNLGALPMRVPVDLPPTKYLLVGEFPEGAPQQQPRHSLSPIEIVGRERRVVLGVPINVLVEKPVSAADLFQEFRRIPRENPAEKAAPGSP